MSLLDFATLSSWWVRPTGSYFLNSSEPQDYQGNQSNQINIKIIDRRTICDMTRLDFNEKAKKRRFFKNRNSRTRFIISMLSINPEVAAVQSNIEESCAFILIFLNIYIYQSKTTLCVKELLCMYLYHAINKHILFLLYDLRFIVVYQRGIFRNCGSIKIKV